MDPRVLELAQLSMARAAAPSGAFAGIAGLEMMRFSMVCRTDHTQLCQLRAVSWRLRAEQSTVASLQQTLDEAADSILDLEDHRDELYYEVDYLAESLRNLRMTHGVVTPARSRESVYVVN